MSCDNLLLLGPDGKVPARNLPSSISLVEGACVEVAFDPLDEHSQGWTEGEIDKVYCRTSDWITTFYRWYRDDTRAEYVVIANNLRFIDGVATVVVDDPSAGTYTRQVDLVLGTPSVTDAGQPLKLSSAQELTHSLSGVTAGTYPASQQGTPGFGGSFSVPSCAVNSTGHVTSADGSPAVTVPDTAASSSAAGLVKIGTDDPVSIDSASGGGHYTPPAGGYVEVAAYDHKHAAASLTVENLPGFSDVYDMHASVNVELNKVLAASVPASVPGAANLILGATSGTATAWRSAADTWADDRVSTSGTTSVDTQAKPIGTLAGLVSGKPALVTLNAKISIYASPDAGAVRNLPDFYTATFTMCNVSRTVAVPAHYARSMAYPVSMSMIVIPSGTSASMTVDTATVFSVEVTDLSAKQLR
jgi:hypothetical protein